MNSQLSFAMFLNEYPKIIRSDTKVTLPVKRDTFVRVEPLTNMQNTNLNAYQLNKPNPYDQIIPNLYIGNAIAPNLYGDRFHTIVNCTPNVNFPPNCKKCIRLSLDDHPSEIEHLYELIIETNVLYEIHKSLENKEPVLVHCHAGMQRSCATVAAYLIVYYGFTPEMTIKYIKKHRPVAFYRGVNFMATIQKIYDNRGLFIPVRNSDQLIRFVQHPLPTLNTP